MQASIVKSGLTNEYIAMPSSALNGYISVVKFILEMGADINAEDACVLCCACANGDTEMVKLLLDRGVDVNAWRALDGLYALDVPRGPQRLSSIFLTRVQM